MEIESKDAKKYNFETKQTTSNRSASNKAMQPTVYAVFTLWFRCRSTLPQCKHRIHCG